MKLKHPCSPTEQTQSKKKFITHNRKQPPTKRKRPCSPYSSSSSSDATSGDASTKN
uniref:Uncharacterized protein n=1 Tax=Torque teno mini virus 10 TaxID=2065036 RepID=A0A3S8RKA4_9VIRU|nr:hypothetical protein ORF3 [Torque teno mini virus 10]AZK35850.1 hypothetical protein ORF3 [Torque teno mini virus 10]